ncbi:MAG: tRNA (adenosine(37)-N6)-threonylcarbamoyltransferase complex dimerization subunit type 1 TsaB [Vogesella sp.]|uniref:tRNA (adenosine(37)-N6)-threonylcarbamoyltransferase complex dimerization subunit type 1 TsaB n=1 Tax=Vogesella sp. TaxID=1904252 RepID=UPI00391B293F
MNLLAIDCSNNNLSLALSRGQHLHTWHQTVRQGHSDHILAGIQQLLQHQQLTLSQLDAILYGKGPGAFTGLRIAAGIALGLATAANIPIVGVSTLDAIARHLPQGNGLAVVDARMGEVYAVRYADGLQQGDITVGAATQLSLTGLTAVAGDCLAPFEQQGLQLIAAVPLASDYIALYQAEPARYPAGNSADLLYVRNKIALTAAEQREQKRG